MYICGTLKPVKATLRRGNERENMEGMNQTGV
jgi:hypothetical protein